LTGRYPNRALIPILDWLFGQHLPDCAVQSAWADLGRLPQPPRTLAERIGKSMSLYPCQLLFVHRDADRDGHAARVEEVRHAAAAYEPHPIIPVVPVRVLEAWLLCDELALRRASGNPNGRQPLSRPSPHQIEDLADPKDLLHDRLRVASGLSGRRHRTLRVSAERVALLAGDFAVLRHLPAFCALEAELATVIVEQGWNRRT
jgi:hypothetical protein